MGETCAAKYGIDVCQLMLGLETARVRGGRQNEPLKERTAQQCLALTPGKCTFKEEYLLLDPSSFAH